MEETRMLSNLFDEYSLGARVKPSLLVLLPIVVTSYIVIPPLYDLVATLLSTIVACGFITVLAHYSRHKGREIEKMLYQKWGGKPTTIILRHSDSTLDRHTKDRYHKYLSENIIDWQSPTKAGEIENPVKANENYDSAIKWLLEKTRDSETYRLLFKENISYGFRRNCFGMKWAGVLFSLLSILLLFFNLYSSNEYIDIERHTLEYAASVFSMLMLFWWLFIVNESWVRDAANSYALRLLAACEL